MALNVCNLKAALVERILQDECLMELVQVQGNIDYKTGRPRIQVAETTPETMGENPYIGVEIADTAPLVADSITHYYKTTVMIFANANSSLRTTRIMDQLMCLFTNCPEDYDKPCHAWCLDLSNACITTKSVKFVRRFRFGRQGQNTYKSETNVWEEGMMVDIVWTPCPCADAVGECNDDFIICPIILPHSTSHPACQCCED